MTPRLFRWSMLVLLLAGVAAWLLVGPPSWPLVAVATVRDGDLEQGFSATGEVKARLYNLSAPASGKVQKAEGHAGDSVARGQLLGVVDDPSAWDRLADAQAQFWTAQSQLNMTSAKLREGHTAVLQAQLEGDRKVAAIRAQALERARDGVLRGSLHAPAAGRLVQVNASAGDYVSAGQTLFQVLDTERIWVQALVAEPDADLVRQGMPVKLRSQSGASYDGVVSQVAGTLEDPPEMPGTARYLRVQVDFSDPAAHPMVGSSVEVMGSSVLARGVHLLPREALVRGAEGDYCVTLRSRRAHRVAVKTGAVGAAWVQLLEGPEPGTPVVVEDPSAWREGQALRARQATFAL